jgi:hypothetical protein
MIPRTRVREKTVTDLELMRKIKSELGDYIAGAVEGTPFPPSLLAALSANESSGVANAQRFEPAVFAELAEVLVLQRPSYSPAGSKRALTAGDLQQACWPQSSPVPGKSSDVFTFPQGVLALKNLATSFGPTQIMGWHSVELTFPLGDLCNLATHFERTVQLLQWFKDRYHLGNDLVAYFHCWNTGSPTAPTFNPNYIRDGLDWKRLYESIPDAPAAA